MKFGILLFLTNIYIDSITKPSYLAKSLALISLYDFKIDLTIDWKTIGGNTPIRDYIPNLDFSALRSLRKKYILYMDQLVSAADGNNLLTWNEVKN